jgi:hypothetical protein
MSLLALTQNEKALQAKLQSSLPDSVKAVSSLQIIDGVWLPTTETAAAWRWLTPERVYGCLVNDHWPTIKKTLKLCPDLEPLMAEGVAGVLAYVSDATKLPNGQRLSTGECVYMAQDLVARWGRLSYHGLIHALVLGISGGLHNADKAPIQTYGRLTAETINQWIEAYMDLLSGEGLKMQRKRDAIDSLRREAEARAYRAKLEDPQARAEIEAAAEKAVRDNPVLGKAIPRKQSHEEYFNSERYRENVALMQAVNEVYENKRERT